MKVGQKPPKEIIKAARMVAREAARHPEEYDPECPPSSSEALKEFAQLAVERNRRKKKRSVTIRIAPDVLENYKTMGNGYTGIMADVLKYAVDNPNILSVVTTGTPAI
jgi:uncharacterized protein (DUF4415 family)